MTQESGHRKKFPDDLANWFTSSTFLILAVGSGITIILAILSQGNSADAFMKWATVGITSALTLIAARHEYRIDLLRDNITSTGEQASLLHAEIRHIEDDLKTFAPLFQLTSQLLSSSSQIPRMERVALESGVSDILQYASTELRAILESGVKRTQEISELVATFEDVKSECDLLGVHWCVQFDYLNLLSLPRWRQYLEANYQLIASGGAVTRIFLFSKESLSQHTPQSNHSNDEAAWRSVFDQWEKGIRICIVTNDRFTRDERSVKENLDYMILTKRVSSEAHTTNRQVYAVQYHEPDLVKRAAERQNANPYLEARRVWPGLHDEFVTKFLKDFTLLEERGVILTTADFETNLKFDEFKTKLQEILEANGFIETDK